MALTDDGGMNTTMLVSPTNGNGGILSLILKKQDNYILLLLEKTSYPIMAGEDSEDMAEAESSTLG